LAAGHPASIEALLGQGQERRPFFFEQRRLGHGLAAQSAQQIVATLLFQVGVEAFQAADTRHGHEEVTPREANQAFDLPLLVRSTDQAEVTIEQVVALDPQEITCQFTFPLTDDFGHGGLGVVVADPCRYAAEELEGPTVTFQKGLAALAREDAAEDRIAVHQRHDEDGHLDLFALEDYVGVTEVDLSLARRVYQRHEHLGVLVPPGPHGVLDDRVAAVVVVYGTQSVEDAFGGVTLLAGRVPVLLENLMDDRQEWLQLPLGAGLGLPIAWRLTVLQDLRKRVPMQAILLAGPSFAELFGEYASSDLGPKLHVGVHPWGPRRMAAST